MVARSLRQNARVWTCPTCQRATAGLYCPTCGERARDPRELTLRGLLDQAFEAFTNIDGRLLHSFRCLVARPGALTVAFLDGRRKPYLGPFSLFLVTNVLFFAVESLTRGLVFSTPLDSHLHTQPWSDVMQTVVANRLAAQQTTLALYAPKFDGAIALHARSLVLLMAVAFAPLTAIMFRRSRQPFAAHAVFSLHFYAFTLLLLTAGSLVPAAGMPFGMARFSSARVDAVLSIALTLGCATYLYLAVGTVYGGTRIVRTMRAAALTIAAVAIVLGYRFALLLLTLFTTS